MKFKCVGTGSQQGNCYILESETQALILDCGLPMRKIKKSLGWNTSKVVGVLASHGHSDHIKAFEDFLRIGIPVYTNDETADHFETVTGERMTGVPQGVAFKCGEFTVSGLYVPHDGTSNFAFLISHEESGNILYATDMFKMVQIDENYQAKKVTYTDRTTGELKQGNIQWTFEGKQALSHMIIECNYDVDMLVGMESFKKEHVGYGHHSLRACKKFVKDNMTPLLRTVTLVHLSRDNSNAERFLKEIKDIVGSSVEVNVAKTGLEISLNRYPF